MQKQKHKKETTGDNKRRPNKQSQRNVYIMPSDDKLYSLCQENAALKIIHPEHYELQALERMTLNPKPYKHQPLLGWGAETNFIQTRNRPARQFSAQKHFRTVSWSDYWRVEPGMWGRCRTARRSNASKRTCEKYIGSKPHSLTGLITCSDASIDISFGEATTWTSGKSAWTLVQDLPVSVWEEVLRVTAMVAQQS